MRLPKFPHILKYELMTAMFNINIIKDMNYYLHQKCKYRHYQPFCCNFDTTLTLDSLDSGLFLARELGVEFGVESGFRTGIGDSNTGVEGPLTRP